MLDKNIHYYINFSNLEESYEFQKYMFKKRIVWINKSLYYSFTKYLVLKYVDTEWLLGSEYLINQVKVITPNEIKRLLDNPLKLKIRKLKRLLKK